MPRTRGTALYWRCTVSLHGSLDTFALADVLALLSTTGKKGELRVDGPGRGGSLWVDGGKIVGGAAGTATEPVDVLFELLRLHEGEFEFRAGADAPDAHTPVAVDDLLGEAQSRLGEWRAIEAVIPSLEATVELSADVAGDEVRFEVSQWRTVVAVARAATVHGVMERLGSGEFDTCRNLKGLVEMGVVAVGTAPDLDEVMGEEPRPKVTKASASGEPDLREVELSSPREDDDDDEDDGELVSIPARKRRTAKPEAKADSKSEKSEKPEKTGLKGESKSEAKAAANAEPKELGPEEAAQLVKQLTSLTGDEDEAQRAVEAFEKGELDGDDPINRGLLLKFLSSVRS
jgi:hypothetical protein